jgi:hypothetical protein
MNNVTGFKSRTAAASARRARDAEALVAKISDGSQSWQNYSVYAPAGYGIPTVELAHSDLPGRIRLTRRQAEELGAALIEAAKRARE